MAQYASKRLTAINTITSNRYSFTTKRDFNTFAAYFTTIFQNLPTPMDITTDLDINALSNY
jgi:hypothetical protein